MLNASLDKLVGTLSADAFKFTSKFWLEFTWNQELNNMFGEFQDGDWLHEMESTYWDLIEMAASMAVEEEADDVSHRYMNCLPDFTNLNNRILWSWSPALMGIAPSGRLPLWQINTLSL